MPYSFINFLQAKQAIAQRLYDSSEQFFADSECGAYIQEALQAFNAFSNFYRQEFVFDTAAATTWYDLTNTTSLPNTLRPMTMTDQNLVSLIEYHLLEPQTSSYPLTWTGSKQFQITDLLNAIQQLRDQVLSESGCTVTQTLVNAGAGRIFLNDTALDLRRVCWLPVSNLSFSANCLLPSDIWATQSYEAGFPQLSNGTPQLYRRSTEPPLSFDVDIQPAVNGKYDVLTVNAGATLSTAQATTLPLPNDWSWVAKYGALAQLLARESVSSDRLRAQYAAARYKHGIAAMRAAPALLAARINDVPVIIEALSSGDFYDANWQAKTPAQPQSIYYAGLNMLGFSPIPNGIYGVTASVVSNMTLPARNADFLQIGRDDVNAVLDYAQHIAMFKCGGEEFTKTFPLFQNFLRHCSLYNSKLKAQSPWLEFIDGRAWENQKLNPTFSKPDPAQVTNG